MAIDAFRKLSDAVTVTMEVAATKTATGGMFVIHSGADNKIDVAPADSFLAIGVAKRPGEAYVAGDKPEIYCSNGIVPVVVGTGGATRGKKARLVATGVTDAPAAAAGGGTMIPLYGTFMQSGNAGDHVGLLLGYSEREIA